MQYPKNYIVWDLETTGLDHNTCKILEIGAMKVMNGEVTEQKNWMLNHGVEVPGIITEITGITQEMADAGVDPKMAMSEFLEWFDGPYTGNLTHNGFKFDIPFLLAGMTEEQRVQYKDKIAKGCIDSAVMFKARGLVGMYGDEFERMWNESFLAYAARVMEKRQQGLKYNVAHCCETLEIDRSKVTQHRALGDVYLTNEIFKKLTFETPF